MDLKYLIQVNVFAMLILLIIFFGMRQKKDAKTVHKRIFTSLIIINFLLLVFDFSVDFISYFNQSSLVIPLYIAATLLYILIPVPSFLWLLYVEYFIFKDLRRVRAWKNLFVIPIYINIVLIFINYFTPFLFRISADGLYERGHLFVWVVSLSYMYLTMSVFHLTKYRKLIRKKDFAPMMMFVVPVMIGGLLQSFVVGLLTVWTSLSLSILLIYLFIQSKIIQSDYLTGLYNKREFDVRISEISKRNLKQVKLAMMIMDIDNFKHINDKYGHPMGDLALQAFSNVLRSNFRVDDFVARIGGDEFAVILEIEKKSDVEHVILRLKESFENYNSNNHLPFEINFSLGFGVFDGQKDHSFNDFIKEIDDKMYIQKTRKQKDSPINYDTSNSY